MIGLSLLCLSAMISPVEAPRIVGTKGECLIFVLKDCPIANQYAPEIQRIVKDYSAKGIQFSLVYADTDADPAKTTEHARAFGYKIPIAFDTSHEMAKKLEVSVSPTAVLKTTKKVYYTGRIDDMYPAIGKRRAKATSHELRDALDAFLADKPIKVTKTDAVGCRLY
jgi:hypothetical protein